MKEITNKKEVQVNRGDGSGSRSSSVYSATYAIKDDIPTAAAEISHVVYLEKEFFIQDLNLKFNELQDTFAQQRDPASILEREKPMIVNDVTITPGTMVFKDAYDGKSFNQTLTITNCGKHSVNVRIFPPTSKAFKIKPAKTSHILSSGISLVRKIRFLYTKPTAIPQALMMIYVNNTCIKYELLVITSYTQISVTPKIIDFGDIDVGMVSAVKYLTIRNSGSKQAHFSIDIGRNQMEVCIEPMKGTVQPNESKEISVEVFGTTEGEFQQEFWIKTEPLQRVYIQGTFIEPTLKVDYPLADRDFLILDFPKTFVGARQQKNVVINNHSSTNAVFCVMGRSKNGNIPLKNAGKIDINYRQFYINPLEGRLHSNQEYIMGITFVPQKPKNRPSYYICALVIDVKRCRVGNAWPQDNHLEHHNVPNASPLLDVISVTSLDEHGDCEQKITTLEDMITVLLYGEVEIPHITMDPRRISCTDLKLGEGHVEPVKILNNSKTLPLIIKYKKIACVEVEPKTILLPPNVAVDAIVMVKPNRMGVANIDIIFDVFYPQSDVVHNVGTVSLNVVYTGMYNSNVKLLKKREPYFVPGITPLETHEVGYLVKDIRFNSRMEKPRQAIVDRQYIAMDKTNDALIAFPNDLSKSMRPWRNTVPCQTIFAKLPRIITEYDKDYDLNPKEKVLRDNTESYYRKYIKSLALKHHKIKDLSEVCGDYITTNEKLILMQNLKLTPEYFPILKNFHKQSLFVPLTPYELINIIVTPKFIQLGKLSAYSKCSNHFNIENTNGFPVHISIKALYSSISIPQELFILDPNSQKKINFTYHSDSSGTHHIPMFIILNFFHVIDITVLAKIVTNTVKCLTKDVLIMSSERTTFLELRNPINSDVKFMIDTTYFQLESFPSTGIIPAKRNITCTITFNPKVGYMPVKEIAVVSESGAKELVEVHFDRKRAAVCLSTAIIDFGNVPLNTVVSKELIIKNISDQLIPVAVHIEHSALFPEMSINPMRSLIWQKGDLIVKFTLSLKEVVEFSFPVNITFQYEYVQSVTVTGRVIFPEVHMRPGLLKIPKIPSGSLVTSPIRLTNASVVTNFISFPVRDFPEFTIKTKSGEDVSNGITLGPKEKKDLYLEFNPQEPVAYCIYLPYILNGIIGPPELNMPNSLHHSEYLNTIGNDYKTSEENIPHLKVIKVLCAAGKKWLNFSSLKLKFCNFERAEQEFVVTNVSDTVQEIMLDITNMKYFNFIPSDNIAIVEDNFTTILAPEESSNITVRFNPVKYGKFISDIPIFVKDYSDSLIFNSLQLIGDNPEPKIDLSRKMCYFLPTSIGSRLEQTLTVELTAHKCDGILNIEGDVSHMVVWCTGKENVSDMKVILSYTVMFVPMEDCVIETTIKFSCPCNTYAEMEVFACGDSCSIINFMADPATLDQCTYPYFPEVNDQSKYAIFLHSVIPIVERWLFSQGFVYRNYYKIPDDIARFPVNFEVKKQSSAKAKKTEGYLPLVQLLINLMDRSILKYIDNKIRPTSDMKGKTLYNYATYRNTISFLKSQGIHVPGLKPEHLMPYEEYIYFRRNLIDTERTLMDETYTDDQFYRFSKQKWLDLFLKIYKVLVFERIVDPRPIIIATEGKRRQTLSEDQEDEKENDFLAQDKKEVDKYIKKKFKRFPNWFKCDAKLLLWLEYHYNRQRAILWPEEDFGSYTYFDSFSNMDDSVALATVTVAYCPYLANQLRDVYARSKHIEHRVHNACKVVQAWKSLKFSFDIHPQTIVSANRMKILLIVTYLYEVLPHFYPTNEVQIEAQLSDSATYELSVANCGDATIKYAAIFFGGGSDLFKVDNSQITIAPKQSKIIKLTYIAKKVLEAKSILVLSGEASGQKYAKSMAVSITGIPKTSECTEINIQVDTYEPAKKKITLQSPYGKVYTAKISICLEEPKSCMDFHDISNIKSRNIPREVNVIQKNCKFEDKGESKIVLDMCLLSQGLKTFYLYFRNDAIGDFCVLISIMSVTRKSTATTYVVNLPAGFTATCSCKQGINLHCPKAFKVDIPSKNESLWTSTQIVMRRSFSDSVTLEKIKKFFGTPLVFRMIKFYLERFPQGFLLPSTIFDDSAEFTITPNKKYSPQRPTLKIRDVTSEDTVPLLIHWNDQNVPSEEYIELRNTNDKEIRYIKLLFVKPKISKMVISDSHIKKRETSISNSKVVSGSVMNGSVIKGKN